MHSKVNLGGELVSIIIVSFNQAHYLNDAIESALAQTIRPIEIIVVDDGSTDRTAEVARSYPEVAYIYQDNQGVCAARNAGLRRCSGNYVGFLDGDDRLLPNAAEAGLDCFRKHPDSGFVFGRYYKVDISGAPISPANQPHDEDDFYHALLQQNLIGMQSTVLYERNILERSGGFDGRFRSAEDYHLYLRIAREFPVHKHDAVIAEYRMHGNNLTLNYRFVLETALRVLDAQVPYASCNPRYKEALKAGILNWRKHYGTLMMQDFRKNLQARGLDRSSIGRLGNLASAYPQGIGLMTKKALRSVIHRALGMTSQ